MREFEEAVDRYQSKVYSFARYWIGDPDEAADVTQDVFLRLWRHWKRVRKETMQSWLIRTTRNACIDRLRRRKLQRVLFPGRSTAEDPLDRAAQPPMAGTDPERGLSNKGLARSLAQALRRLKEPLRAVVILREIQGLTYREISETLSLPINTVKVYLHRGRRTLREELEEEYVAPGA